MEFYFKIYKIQNFMIHSNKTRGNVTTINDPEITNLGKLPSLVETR